MTQTPLTRRRFMSICATAGALSTLPCGLAFASLPLHRWNGILLGSYVSLTLAHPSKQHAERIFALCVNEIKRLENIFTLYDSHSELSRLNKEGVLNNPSPEMLEILKSAKTYNQLTDGAFDITVKALEDGQSDLTLVSMSNLEIGDSIRFIKPNIGITLNGIAQGYITDRITNLLRQEGLSNVLVELGEKRAIGAHPEGRPWLLKPDQQQDAIPLIDQALATSALHSPNTGSPHIYDPKTGKAARTHKTISVRANTATMADALSTGFMSMSNEQIKRLQNTRKDIYDVYIT